MISVFFPFILSFLSITPSWTTTPSHEKQAQTLVRQFSQGIEALGQHADKDQYKIFHRLLSQHFAFEEIAIFCLGPRWKSLSPHQRTMYKQWLSHDVLRNYKSQMFNHDYAYQDKNLTVTKITQPFENEWHVHCQLKRNQEVYTVIWVISKLDSEKTTASNTLRITTLLFDTLDFVDTKRQEIEAAIQNAGGIAPWLRQCQKSLVKFGEKTP